MWRIKLTNAWQNSVPLYSSNKPKELAAVLRNLERYLALLRASKSSKAVEAAYLHREISAIVSIDEQGFEAGLEETRLYTFADDSTHSLYLLGIGEVAQKHADMEYYKQCVYYIVNENQ